MIENAIFGAAFGERLRFERERLGFTQADFAAQVGINRMTQASYESGKRSPDAIYLAVASELGVDVGYVLFNARKDKSERIIEAFERLLMQLCDDLCIPAEKVEQAMADLRGMASNQANYYQTSEDVRMLAGKLLRVSTTLNASVKILELDRDMLTDIIAGLERQATDTPVAPSQKALLITRIYRMFSEKGVIDQDTLVAAARSLSRS